MSKMDYQTMAAFLAQPLSAVFVTLRADGSPHAAPVWYEFTDGEFRVFTSDTFPTREESPARQPRGDHHLGRTTCRTHT